MNPAAQRAWAEFFLAAYDAVDASESCRLCRTWVCANCGWTRRRAKVTDIQFCNPCGSMTGWMNPVHHRRHELTLEHEMLWRNRRCCFNYGKHICPGCEKDMGHGWLSCPDCEIIYDRSGLAIDIRRKEET